MEDKTIDYDGLIIPASELYNILYTLEIEQINIKKVLTDAGYDTEKDPFTR